MSISLKTLLISSLITFCCLLPRYYSRIKAHSQTLLLVGAGGLISLYFGDLVPDVLRLGGAPSLVIILLVWAAYSLAHVFHLTTHEHEHEHEHGQDHGHDHGSDSAKTQGTFLLMAAMVSHCFSSGMLLAVSHELSARLATTVFLALVAHKGYEALSFSILLAERIRKNASFLACIGIYALSFPLGVALVTVGETSLGLNAGSAVFKTSAVVISSVAVGSLMGCMIHDFLLPSLRHVRQNRYQAGWLLLGGALTFLFTVAA